MDYWAFGVLIYELLCQRTPFLGRNQQRTFEKIVHSQKFLSFSTKIDAHSKSLLRKLLNPNPSIRLGCLRNGSGDVKEHAYFSGVDFEKLSSCQIEMPFIPDPKHNLMKILDIHNNESSDLLNLKEEISIEHIPSVHDEFWDEIGQEAFSLK
jgi:serine/threonine protein kinase